MVWSQLDVTKAHVAYAVVAVFSTMFSLCSLFVKEKLYLGEASVATIYGLIVGPHCLNWFNPFSWGNYFYITLEISRVLLCIEIVAVSVELPKKYILKHWFSVFLLLIPCMTAGWLIIGAFIYAIIPGLSFSYGLLISACITATDPILAQAVVGKGKFAKRVPAHLRNLLSAESACNDGVSVPFVYLALNIILHSGNSKEIAKDWICVTVLYECGFGCILGSFIGYAGRKLLRLAENYDLIDRESFLAFYIMLALLCAGFGSILGIDDLLASFCAGTAFAWDGWFTDQTEESNVSTVIDILLNMAYFVYFGSIIPWEEFNDASLGLNCWRLICLALVVLFLRRLPAVLLTKIINPDIKNWKEAIFVGHFGPIGVGAVFAAIIAISDLEADVLHISHGPTTNYPEGSEFYQLIRIIWPTVCFLILTSIIIHGSSVAVLTLGRQLQTMTFTMTWTKAETEAGKEGYWFNRLPKIERSGTSFSLKRVDTLANQGYGSDNKITPSATEIPEIMTDEYADEKVNARLNANIGLERFGDMDHIPEIETSGKHVRPVGGANRKKQKRLLRRKKSKKRKQPPVSEVLDLGSHKRVVSADEQNYNSNESIINDEINVDDYPVDHNNKVIIPLEKVITNGSSLRRSETNESITSSMHGVIHANPGALRKITSNYEITEDDLKPVVDEDGELRIPTNAYNYDDALVIEDQHGEILHTVSSRNNTVESNNSSPIRSRATTVSKHIANAIGLLPSISSHDEAKPVESTDSSVNIPRQRTIEERLDEPTPPKRRSTISATLNKISGLSDNLLFKNTLPRKTRKIHGYRVNDDIIIENEDGEILGRYKVNVKKQKAEQAQGLSSNEINEGLVNKAMKYIGLKREREHIDEEMSEINNDDFIPEAGNEINSDTMEQRIKHLINADPNKAVVNLPQSLHHMHPKKNKAKSRAYLNSKSSEASNKKGAPLKRQTSPPPPPQSIGSEEDYDDEGEDGENDEDDEDDEDDGNDQNSNDEYE